MASLEGLRAVEVSLGQTAVGAGLASSLPGTLFRELGAEVIRVQSRDPASLDADLELTRVWNYGKRLVEVDDLVPAQAAETIAGVVREADVVFLAGDEALLEQQGVTSRELGLLNPRLVVARIRPSRNALGAMPDLELVVQARTGLLTQVRGHRLGPAFCSLPLGAVGAGLSAAVGALACLYEREATGRGGWAETSLYDGVQALLPLIIGRVEHPSRATTMNWQSQGPAESLCYRCADGGYVQLWFGAKGAYEAFLAHIGDPPSEHGYHADMSSDALTERGKRWAAMFATRDREWWLNDFAGQGFRCEPALRPGEALADPHLRQTGLSIDRQDPELGQVTVLGPVVRVAATGSGEPQPGPPGGRLLAGVRVLDLSAYLAGPVATRILAQLGADVIKVEPVTGDAHRTVEPLFVSAHLGKRVAAVNLKSPDAPAVLERLFQWSDVVHHNSRVGLAERLGYDEATARAANPGVVYSFASGFGAYGPRATLPTNDQLMQALAGIEASQGGEGQPPTYLSWGAVDVTGGWIAACGILAALYARRRRGGGQSVASSLLGAGLTLKSGAFLAGGQPLGGPVLDPQQTGYGAAYRIYEGADGAWFALAAPDATAWRRLRDVVGLEALPEAPPALRTRGGAAQPEELRLEKAFAVRPAAEWVAELRAAGVPVEPIAAASRSEFAAGFLDDTGNRQLGQVVSYRWGNLGQVEQLRFPLRLGPAPMPAIAPGIPQLGEHTAQVLEFAGFDAVQRDALAASGTVGAV